MQQQRVPIIYYIELDKVVHKAINMSRTLGDENQSVYEQ